jgi:hypothetical protein
MADSTNSDKTVGAPQPREPADPTWSGTAGLVRAAVMWAMVGHYPERIEAFAPRSSKPEKD